jgi:hypothetical protein
VSAVGTGQRASQAAVLQAVVEVTGQTVGWGAPGSLVQLALRRGQGMATGRCVGVAATAAAGGGPAWLLGASSQSRQDHQQRWRQQQRLCRPAPLLLLLLLQGPAQMLNMAAADLSLVCAQHRVRT